MFDIWDKVFKNGPSKICRRRSLKNFTWFVLDYFVPFGIKKNGKTAMQFKPYLKVNNEVIQPVKISDSFEYLGKSLSSSMSCEAIKTELIKELAKYLEKNL